MSTLSTCFPPAADYKTEHSIHTSCSILSPHAKRLPQIGLRLLRPWLCLTWDKTIRVFLFVCFHFHPHHARWEKLGLVGFPTSRCWFLVIWLLRWKVPRLPPMSTDQWVYVCVWEGEWENELLCLYRAFVIFGLRNCMALLFLKEEKNIKKQYKSTCVFDFFLSFSANLLEFCLPQPQHTCIFAESIYVFCFVVTH